MVVGFSEAHRAALGGMVGGIRVDQSCDGPERNVVADSPWRVQMCCASGARRRIRAWPRKALTRSVLQRATNTSHVHDSRITTQAHAWCHPHTCSNTVSSIPCYSKLARNLMHCFVLKMCLWERCSCMVLFPITLTCCSDADSSPKVTFAHMPFLLLYASVSLG